MNTAPIHCNIIPPAVNEVVLEASAPPHHHVQREQCLELQQTNLHEFDDMGISLITQACKDTVIRNAKIRQSRQWSALSQAGALSRGFPLHD